ncbi:hypothetical protein H8E88_35055 [candidate division KSB1 bacterium]|nr:hypothetical protein [candidate division KSB1 bacterium]
MKSKIIKIAILIFCVLLLLYFAKDIMKFAYNHVVTPLANFVLGNQITDLKMQIQDLNNKNRDNEVQFKLISDSLTIAYTKTSTKNIDLENKITIYTGNNKRLGQQINALLDSLKEKNIIVTSLTKGSSDPIGIRGSGFMGDSIFVDPWIDAKISSKHDFLLFQYKLTMLFEHIDIQGTDEYGNETHLNSYKFVSSKNGQEYFLPVKDSVFTQKEKYPLFHWWNPKLHGGIILQKAPGPYLGFNIATIGHYKGIEHTWAYLEEIGLGYNEENIILLITPIDFNVGSLLPIVSNLNIAPMARFSENGWGFSIVLGAVF